MGQQSDRTIVGIHLDLKGTAFKPAYIPALLRDLAGQKINTVLLEYEDVFPFEGMRLACDPASVWSRGLVRRFQREAERNGIEVIPLQQCLGHLEYLFRWERYARLAQHRPYPSTLRLSSREGRRLVLGMLGQVLDAHPGSRYVHLGMDEAHGLVQAADEAGRPVAELFVEWLLELVELVEARGKTPVIWSDMLEDHFARELFEPIRDRVILNCWDYISQGRQGARGRICGWRTSREWLDEPENPAAPPLGMGTRYFEDLPPAVKRLVAPYRKGRLIDSLFQVDMWTQLGYRLIGATAVRISADGPVLPLYHSRQANIRSFADAIRRNGQLGLIGTSWARGTTFCPPNFSIDLAWPNVSVLSEAMGLKPAAFFPGAPRGRVATLVRRLGRCRQDWSLEAGIAKELDEIEPSVTAHRHEWKSLRLMTRVLALHRRADFCVLEVDYFRAAGRPVAAEWDRRLREQRAVLSELAALKREVRAHFGRRYEGLHFEEWLADLFDAHAERLRRCGAFCRAKRAEARARYAAP